MSLSEIIIKLLGLGLALIGFALLTSTVGLVFFGIALPNIFAAIIVGVIFLGGGIYIIRGGNLRF
jgi:hypothetical protein